MNAPNLHGTSDRIRSEIEFGLAIATFFGSIWYFGFETILSRTEALPGDPALDALAISHGVFFALFMYSVILLADMGLSFFTTNLLPTDVYKVFFYVWPIGLLFILLQFLVRIDQFATSDRWVQGIVGASITISFLIAFIGIRNKKSTLWQVSGTIGLLLLTAVFHEILMAAVLPDVDIETDKELYSSGEEILVSVRPVGYLFNPTVNTISVDGFKNIDWNSNSGCTFRFAYPKDSRSSHIIAVNYSPQLSFYTRVKWHYLRVAEKSLN